MIVESQKYLEKAYNLKLPHKLRKYQLEGISFLCMNDAALLADEMGLGKTVQVAVALEIIYRKKGSLRTLVVAPASLKMNWENELKRWANSLSIQRIVGGAANRWAYFHLPYNVVVASYEDVRAEFYISNITEKYDIVVLDEAQRIKNPNSNTSTMCKTISREVSWALTGTPVENSKNDLISLFSFLKLGLIDEELRKEEIHKRIKNHFLRRRKVDVLGEMPPIIEQDLLLELTGEQRNSYETCLLQTRSDFAKAKFSDGELLALITKLKKICNYDPISDTSVKLDALTTICDDVLQGNSKLLVFSQYVQTLKWLSKRLERYNHYIYSGELNEKEKNEILVNFEETPEPSILFISLKAGGVGLNIQAADVVIMFDRWWNPAVEQQAVARAHRFGRNKPLHVIKFIVVDTIEERILTIINRKKDIFEQYVDQAEGFPSSLYKTEIFNYLIEHVEM